MAKKQPLLEKMRSNPRNNWKAADVEKLVNQAGLTLRTGKSGSHLMIVSSPHFDFHLTVPFKRPIKPVYIRQLVSLADDHLEAVNEHGQ